LVVFGRELHIGFDEMSVIQAQNVVVDFPLYGTSTRSLKKTLVRAATGGTLAKDASERVVVRALDNVSFEFHDGDRIGLIGHNGSGKSTLLRVLAGIYEPQGGTLSVRGRVTSMLSITLGMDMEATGLENIFLRGHVMGAPPRQMRGLIDEISDFTGLGEYLNLPMRTYSSGMTMRLAFAVATSLDADIILMDEWLSAGDADFVDKAKERLNKMVKGARIVVLASHNQALINDQCSRVIKLEHGKIVE
jgi:lipopolysaccharide transport system ATP-binding protein